MRKQLWVPIVLVIGLLAAWIVGVSIQRQRRPLVYRFPGEFETQQAIWLQWPSGVYNTGPHPVNPVMVKVIKALTPYIRVNLLATSTQEISDIKIFFTNHGFSGTNVHFYRVDHLSIWARDVGPIFIKDNRDRLAVVDFGFNNYSRGGDPSYIKLEGQVDWRVGRLLKLPVIRSSLISEGGAIESNGRGTMMVVGAVALKRNPTLTKEQIEKEYQRVLGVSKVIWLDKGLAEDDRITSGHIDEIARFADPHTILLAQVLPEDRDASSFSRNSYSRLEENYRILSGATDQDGKPFRIIRIPIPPTFYREAGETGDLPVRSYLNYALTNGAVVMQSYWMPGRPEALKKTEADVQTLFGKIFPGRKIIGVNTEDVNRWGGGIHCITQHMPAE